MPLWPHQSRAIETIPRDLETVNRLLCAGPTGSGKGVIIEKAIETFRSAVLYTDRRMLLDQTAHRLRDAGFQFGIRASGHPENVLPPIQLCMRQTEDSRVLQGGSREHVRADAVILDEAHRLRGEGAMGELLKRHRQDGSKIVGFTATPAGLGDDYDKLRIMATKKECRECGALIPARTFAPDEPDTRHLKRMATGDFEPTGLRSMYKRPVVFGRVLDNWRRLNTEERPTLLFGPDVKGAQWFQEQFQAAGVPAGHIDGDKVIIGDEILDSTTETRDQLRDALFNGDIKIVTNRFVLREGVDWPWVSCAIFATAFGSITSYDQAGGRILRASPATGKRDALIIDHGGNYHRHGSLNADRLWALDKTDRQMVKEREERLRNQNTDTDDPKEPEPIACPKCAGVRSSGRECPYCGHVSTGKSRVVVQLDGNLREIRGDIYAPRKVSTDPADVKAWKACYFRCRNSKRNMTFNQAAALFCRENGGRWPDPSWPFMPKSAGDKYRHIKDVPRSELNGGPGGQSEPQQPTDGPLFAEAK